MDLPQPIPRARRAARATSNAPKQLQKTAKDSDVSNISNCKEYTEHDASAEDPGRNRLLKRNRIAATKCRLRKRNAVSELSTREQDMEDENRRLATCLESLTAEIYYLKTQLLLHHDCDCVLIQKYIASEARKSVDGLIIPIPGPENMASIESNFIPPSTAHQQQQSWIDSFQGSSQVAITNATIIQADSKPLGIEPSYITTDPATGEDVLASSILGPHAPDLDIGMAVKPGPMQANPWQLGWRNA